MKLVKLNKLGRLETTKPRFSFAWWPTMSAFCWSERFRSYSVGNDRGRTRQPYVSIFQELLK